MSFDEKIIKKHQIDNLKKYSRYPGIISGFIFNFADYDNQTYFLPIDKFIYYKETTNRKSIPLEYIAENGVEIKHRLKVKNYKYFLDEFVNNFK